MHIGVLTTSFPRYHGDVAGSFVLGSAQALVQRGHRVTVLAPEPAYEGTAPRWPGIQVHWVPYCRPVPMQRTFYGDGVLCNAERDWRAWPGLLTFVPALVAAASRGHSWDALVSHWALPCALAASAIRRGRPHLAVFHSADVWALRRLPRWLVRQTLRGCTATWFVRDEFRKAIFARGDMVRPGFVAPMGIFPPATTMKQRPRRSGKHLRALFLGRLVPIKGVDVVLRALQGIEGVTLTVAGDGHERTQLEAFARRASLPVRFVGAVCGERKERLWRTSDVLVLSSRALPSGQREGVPTVALEAALRGIPIVASDDSGLGEVFPDDAVYWVPTNQPDALRQSLVTLRADTGLRRRMALAGERVARAHLWHERVRQMESHLCLNPSSDAS